MRTPGLQHRLLSTILAGVLTMGAALRGQAPDTTALRLGEASAPPGAGVVSPLILTRADDVTVGSVEVRLTFPKALLKFVKIQPSGLALGIDATVRGDVKDGPDGQSSTLHVSVSTVETGGSRKPLPPGPLAYLSFTVAPTAKPQTTIALTHQATALDTGTPPVPVKLSAASAKIIVASPPVPACFFYMH